MPRTQKLLQSFNAGELSPLMDFRIDQQKYQLGCRTMENFYPLIYGGAERRPGTYFVAEAKDSTAKIRMVDFVFSAEQAYVLEFGNQYIRFYANNGRFVGVLAADTASWANDSKYYAGDFAKGTDGDIYRCLITHTADVAGSDGTGGNPTGDGNSTQWENTTDSSAGLTSDSYPIYEVPSPYLTADLFELKFEHSADVMYITHPDYEPRKLSRISSTTFVLEELAYDDGPFTLLNTVLTAFITPSDTTGNITLTASGTNADGTAFEPFQSTHAPSGASGATDSVGTSQTLKAITGTLFKIVHATDANEVDKTFTSVDTSDSLLVYKGVVWDFVTNGTWTGTIKLERSYDQVTWEVLHTVISENNSNVQLDGTEETDDAYYRISATEWTSGSSNCQLSVRDSSRIGIVEITSVSSGTVASATVLSTIGSTDRTHRWAEGYWSNYRGWPNAVSISSEERLTFAGSRSYPLNVWGSVSGVYSSMKAGVLADDAFVFTLVGSGRQNEIRWIATKNAQILGTYGGEHVLGASDDKEALTPTNVTAKIQSTYGSDDIQAKLVGDSILFIQRGGRKLREMSYDFAKDAQVSDDLTVFANHVTESSITNIAYQRIPEPMIWAVRDDGQLAVMSYERAQEVFSWCRVITSTNDEESDVESVCVIPNGTEEESVWVSVKRKVPGNANADASGYIRFIEYFAPRGF